MRTSAVAIVLAVVALGWQDEAGKGRPEGIPQHEWIQITPILGIRLSEIPRTMRLLDNHVAGSDEEEIEGRLYARIEDEWVRVRWAPDQVRSHPANVQR